MKFFRYVFIPAIVTTIIFWLALSVGRDNNDHSFYDSYTGAAYGSYNHYGNAIIVGRPEEKMPYYD